MFTPVSTPNAPASPWRSGARPAVSNRCLLEGDGAVSILVGRPEEPRDERMGEERPFELIGLLSVLVSGARRERHHPLPGEPLIELDDEGRRARAALDPRQRPGA